MTKTPLPLHADDLTLFAKSLSRQLGVASPSHLVLLNMIARAAGFQNVQHMRSVTAAQRRLEVQSHKPPVDMRSVERALFQFDNTGRLRQWPSKRSVQTLALWALWAALPAGDTLHERDVNERLNREHLFSDPATLRRCMISCGLLTRQNDGTDYKRVEQAPPAEAEALIRAVTTLRRVRRENEVLN
ncbi:DUF2087 domain-containing protein [Ruegeria sp. EL01]|jgi:hypothetical protein|uniref:DUF2087 domain-containing protein n=1 Tax=Ruegeria sp. EL01 TaxID=2107578 RepID=UPI000EA8305E|nr:DUF2087 domain-containing protein [Ruegeria sp. EL01]